MWKVRSAAASSGTSSIRCSWVGTRDTKRTSRSSPSRHGRHERPVLLEQHRPVPGDQRPADDLQPRDVRRRQREQPAPGAAEPPLRGGHRGQHRPRGRAPPAWAGRSSRRSRRPAAPARRPPPASRPAPPRRRASRRRPAAGNPCDASSHRLVECRPVPTVSCDRVPAADPAGPQAVGAVDPLRRRRGLLPHRQRGVLHPDRRALRRAGRPRPDHRRGRDVLLRGAARPARGPGRAPADVGARARSPRRCSTWPGRGSRASPPTSR